MKQINIYLYIFIYVYFFIWCIIYHMIFFFYFLLVFFAFYIICWLIKRGSHSSTLSTAIVTMNDLISNRSKKRSADDRGEGRPFESDRHLCEWLRRLSIGSDFCATKWQMKSVCLARLCLAMTLFTGWWTDNSSEKS